LARERSISLHDAGVQLAQLLHSKEKVASGKLLSLLKAGEIEAGFQFFGSTVWWIKIPTRYWATVSTDKFRVIRFTRKSTSGAFKIRLGEFADEIIAQISQQLECQSAPTSEEWKALLKATTLQYEVEIIEREWANFLGSYAAQLPLEKKSGSGRYAKTGWRNLSVIIGAYILKHCKTTNEEIKIQEANENIYKIAKREGIAYLRCRADDQGRGVKDTSEGGNAFDEIATTHKNYLILILRIYQFYARPLSG
jgi:hypothetical protein